MAPVREREVLYALHMLQEDAKYALQTFPPEFLAYGYPLSLQAKLSDLVQTIDNLLRRPAESPLVPND